MAVVTESKLLTLMQTN